MANNTKGAFRGFTLLEVLLVLGLFAIIAALVVSVGLHTHSGFTTQDDVDLAIATLQKARSQSMQGVCEGACTGAVAHGVHVTANSLMLFQGDSFNAADAANEYIPSVSNATTFAGSDTTFAAITGVTVATTTVTVLDNGITATIITIGNEGQLLWSK